MHTFEFINKATGNVDGEITILTNSNLLGDAMAKAEIHMNTVSDGSSGYEPVANVEEAPSILSNNLPRYGNHEIRLKT